MGILIHDNCHQGDQLLQMKRLKRRMLSKKKLKRTRDTIEVDSNQQSIISDVDAFVERELLLSI
jgi:hypothetical protein